MFGHTLSLEEGAISSGRTWALETIVHLGKRLLKVRVKPSPIQSTVPDLGAPRLMGLSLATDTISNAPIFPR